jgi:hypothetical protein
MEIIVPIIFFSECGGVAFSVLFHDLTSFSFRSVSAQDVAEAVFSIKSEAIG